MEAPIDPQLPLTLLGGLSPAQFMRRHWQKKPLLIRQAVPEVTPPVDRAALFKLLSQPEVESRLITQAAPRTRRGTPDWSLKLGPFQRRALPALAQPGWTVLVQGLDQHVPAARELLAQFRFVPEARLDDLMISWASPGGGVGPHFDSYDVFLLQVHGRRRWQIGRLDRPELQEGVPLKILTNFVAEHTWVLEPGDMLYLPPMWAHDGVAESEDCMTCSIGFRAPGRDELVSDLLGRLADVQDHDEQRFRDPGLAPTLTPGRIPQALTAWAIDGVRRALSRDDEVALALGESLTEPKPSTLFPPPDEPADLPCAVSLDPRSRMLYDDHYVYLNGASWRVGGRDARLLRSLADQRALSRSQVHSASAQLRAWLEECVGEGWIRCTDL